MLHKYKGQNIVCEISEQHEMESCLLLQINDLHFDCWQARKEYNKTFWVNSQLVNS